MGSFLALHCEDLWVPEVEPEIVWRPLLWFEYEMSPMGSCVKAYVPSFLALFWEVLKTLGSRPSWKK
jgi:hypothetical protein